MKPLVGRETRDFYDRTFGCRSTFNTLGKIVLSPFIIYLLGIYMVMDFLFGKEAQ